ncbi:MAG: SH3 domain-containing protein [Bacteroidota bacterium]
MKYLLLLILASACTISLSAQTTFEVTARNGLILRDAPRSQGKRIGKLPYGKPIEVLERTGVEQIIIDGTDTIRGEWVKVQFENFPTRISEFKEGYVFSGYLISKDLHVQQLQRKIDRFPLFKGYTIVRDRLQYHIRGDFFGDGTEDLAVLVQDAEQRIKVGFINYGKKDQPLIMGPHNTAFEMNDYDWIGVFESVTRGEVLWSNYVDDFRDFEEVPANEKVTLPYEAMFMHVSEACGGGFVYWKEEKFHWLQQE